MSEDSTSISRVPSSAFQEERAASAHPGKRSHAQVLKSSILIGGSSIIEIAFRIIRTKAIALLVGPAGIGLLGLYSTISEMVRNLSGLGFNTSGVRQIAAAVGTGDDRRIARTVKALRRIAVYSGSVGSLLLAIFSREISRLTFGDDRHTVAIATLALAVFCWEVSDAQRALVQGMRRVSDLVRINVLGVIFGTAAGVAVVYVLGEEGLALSLVCVAGTGFLASWWYARKIEVEPVRMTFHEMLGESSELLRLGVVFMASGFMLMGAAYIVRTIILRQVGVEAAGFYQAAYGLGGVYTSFVLRAMSADFYPRLTAVAHNNAECNRLANEQAEVVLLLACPGALGTLTLAPLVMVLFYSQKFGPAVEILRWICLGMLLQVAAWSVGFIVLAKGARKTFFWMELLSNVTLVGLVWLGLLAFGLEGTGMGFFGMYFLYALATYVVVRRMSGFRWSLANWRLMLIFLPLVAITFVSYYVLPRAAAIGVGGVITLFAAIYSLKTLCALVPASRFPEIVQKILRFARIMGPNPIPDREPR